MAEGVEAASHLALVTAEGRSEVQGDRRGRPTRAMPPRSHGSRPARTKHRARSGTSTAARRTEAIALRY
ncbi:hypothetical protein MPAR168_04545 [Methylorubrum populi]|uniref:EAL domain-containing protein n=1 Tax=Methylobacterium radiotolerans TaxID=31998 RepID=A0ABU7TAI0_9HYPH